MKMRIGIMCSTLLILSLLIGCAKKEMLRKPEWVSDFQDVYFSDSRNGWIVGTNGLILVSHDGGKTWTKQESGTDKDLMAVAFPSPKRGWVAGSWGTVLKTDSSGRAWHFQKIGDATYTGLAFPDAKRGWIVSETHIIHTPDGGKSWEKQAQGTGFPLYDVHFISPREGWASGDFGRVLHTSDGGKRWEGYDKGLTAQQLRAIFFTDSDHGWAAGIDATMFHTSDGGKTWQPQETNLPRMPGSHHRWTINDLHFINSKTGWLAADGGYLCSTEDGGKTWKLHHPGPMNDLRGVWMIDKRTIIAVGIHSTILRTEDGGKTWVTISSKGAENAKTGGTEFSAPLSGVRISPGGKGWGRGNYTAYRGRRGNLAGTEIQRLDGPT